MPQLQPPEPRDGGGRVICSFCGTVATSASLTDGSPICWRPCYAALLKVQCGMDAEEAILDAIEQGPAPVGLLRALRNSGTFDLGDTAQRIFEYALVPASNRKRIEAGRLALTAGA